ncbi:hypothetical protein [Streptomyces axinellae]|uniref:Uncharacterized protein n=1 Tax=Streptomyces axinellae TaxID=552788 RepID=A0ABP6C7P3_9ACTN
MKAKAKPWPIEATLMAKAGHLYELRYEFSASCPAAVTDNE